MLKTFKALITPATLLLTLVTMTAGRPALVSAQDEEVVASLQNLSGRVQVLQKTNGETLEGRPGLLLRSGDTVVTSDQSRATIKFRDGSEIRLFQNTRFVLQGAKESAGNDRSFKLDLVLRIGSLWGNLVKQRQTAQISTPSATIGIKGTTLRVTEMDGKGRVALTEGAVDVSNGNSTVALEAGNRVVDFTKTDNLATKVQPIPYKLEIRTDRKQLTFDNKQPEEVFISLQLVQVASGREVARQATIYFRSNYDKITFPTMAKLDDRGFARVGLRFAPPEAADAALNGSVYVWAVVDQPDGDDTGEGRALFTIPVPPGQDRIRIEVDKGEGKRVN